MDPDIRKALIDWLKSQLSELGDYFGTAVTVLAWRRWPGTFHAAYVALVMFWSRSEERFKNFWTHTIPSLMRPVVLAAAVLEVFELLWQPAAMSLAPHQGSLALLVLVHELWHACCLMALVGCAVWLHGVTPVDFELSQGMAHDDRVAAYGRDRSPLVPWAIVCGVLFASGWETCLMAHVIRDSFGATQLSMEILYIGGATEQMLAMAVAYASIMGMAKVITEALNAATQDAGQLLIGLVVFVVPGMTKENAPAFLERLRVNWPRWQNLVLRGIAGPAMGIAINVVFGMVVMRLVSDVGMTMILTGTGFLAWASLRALEYSVARAAYETSLVKVEVHRRRGSEAFIGFLGYPVVGVGAFFVFAGIFGPAYVRFQQDVSRTHSFSAAAARATERELEFPGLIQALENAADAGAPADAGMPVVVLPPPQPAPRPVVAFQPAPRRGHGGHGRSGDTSETLELVTAVRPVDCGSADPTEQARAMVANQADHTAGRPLRCPNLGL